jgi:hypothetical protein
MKAALSADEPTYVVEYPREMKDSCQIKKGPVMGLGRKTALESSEKFTAKCTDFCNCKKMSALKKQPFISTQQKAFKNEVKENLQPREYLIYVTFQRTKHSLAMVNSTASSKAFVRR